MPVVCDYHMHTAHSNDSAAPMEAMCRAAVDRGLTDIAVTDHVEMGAFAADGFDKAADASFREADQWRRALDGKLRVARGVEMGEPLHDLPATEALLAAYEFDFILASLHNLQGQEDFYYFKFDEMTDEELYGWMDRYFAELADMAAWGRFHALAHLDYPFRYMPAGRRPDYTRWREPIDAILRSLIDRGLALEINTSGLVKPGGRSMPEAEVVRRFRELGGEYVTLGSDAHRPDAVGRGLEAGAALAREAGFRYAAVFPAGRPEVRPL